MLSPNTKEERLRKIASKSNGFLYLVSVYGTTGIRDSFEASFVANYIKNVKRIINDEEEATSLHVAIGFGISKPEHAKMMIDAGADAVIIASAITNIIIHSHFPQKENKNKAKKDMLNEISNFVKAMKNMM